MVDKQEVARLCKQFSDRLVAEKLGLTRGQVAGILHRHRQKHGQKSTGKYAPNHFVHIRTRGVVLIGERP